MPRMSDFPLLIFVLCLALFWASGWGARRLYRRFRDKEPDTENYTLLLGAVLSILGLLIGFTFSMAVSRYDMRKNYEEEEANAIGTEWLRTGLLADEDASAAKTLLRRYLAQRILFYQATHQNDVDIINRDTQIVQDQLWTLVSQRARASQTPVMQLVVSGLNDVINTAGYTQAAWWNRIPRSAWVLLFILAMFSLGMMEFHNCARRKVTFAWLLPLVFSFSFALISDIDSPRGGMIRIQPQNLLSLAGSLPPVH